MGDRKRALDEDDGAAAAAAATSPKLAKKTGAGDVAASKAARTGGGRAAASAPAPPPRGQDAEGNAYWELSKTRRVGVAHFRNTTLVNIREYYDSAGQMRPGKKGISLSLDQYKALVRAIPAINAELRSDGVAISDAEDDDGAAAAGADGEGGAAAVQTDKKKAKAAKAKAAKANIEATSDEDSS